MTDEYTFVEHPPKVSVIIPFYNRWDLTHPRLAELYKFAPTYCEIILVDDCSSEQEVRNGIAWWQHKANPVHHIRYYRNKENLGFGGSLNVGVSLAKGEIVVLLSNDVVMYADIISDIVTLIGQDNKMLVCGRVVDFPGGWNEFDIDGKHLVVPYAEGWLLACTKQGWKDLGGFDLHYGKYDYEDVDLSTRALQLNFHIVPLNSPNVRHLVGQTIATLNVNRPEKTVVNRQVYLEKWGSSLRSILEKTYETGTGAE